MEINRITGPPIKPLEDIKLPEVSFYTLSNGIPVYEINSGTQDAFKIEILTVGGRLLEDKKLVSRAASVLIKDATEDYSQKELAHQLDFYGATLSSKFNMDVTSLILFSLGKYGEELIPILASIYLRPLFQQSEFENFIERNINNLNIELTKNDVLAYREFTESIFGEDHIYGFNSTPKHYKDLTSEDVRFHYNTYYGTANTVIILSGKISDGLKKVIDRELGQFKKPTNLKQYIPSKVPMIQNTIKLKGKSVAQDSVIIGRRLFDKEHLDYPKMIVTNTILGGYFGSRLMKSVREDKGFTYNISSFLEMLKYDGFFYISTDVDPNNTEKTISEIYRQIEILTQKKISDGELQMVKNYIMGNVLNMLDGPFRISNWVKSLITHDISLLKGHETIYQMNYCTGQDVQEMAAKYLQKENLTELIVTI
jgi:predicted Zn-dependent peptidase